MTPRTQDAFYVADWLVEPSLNRISRPGEQVTLEPRLMRMLVHLAAQRGDVVSRDALMDAVWGPTTVISTGTLTGSVSELRKALQDPPQQPRIVETIRSRGYRLIAPVRDAAAVSGDAHTAPPEPAPVLPARAAANRYRVWGPLALVLGVLALVWLLLPVAPQQRLPARIVPLTTLPGAELGPVFSPDGHQIAFVRFDEARFRADVYVKAVGGASARQVTARGKSGGMLYPAWSPDGQTLAFFWNRASGCGIYTVPAAGGPLRKMLDLACAARHLTWSPDGRWLVFSYLDAQSGQQRLHRLEIETLTLTPLTRPGTGTSDLWPTIAPDGRMVAFRRWTSDQSADLYTVPLDGHTPEQRLTQDDVPLQGHDWTPDGRAIIFASHRADTKGVWRIPARGGTPVLLRSIGANDMDHLNIARQGQRMAYVQWNTDVNVRRMPGPAAPPEAAPEHTRIITSTYTDWDAQYAPNGAHLAFISNRSGTPELWLSNAAGAQAVQLTTLGNPTVSRPRWSPDGRHLAFEARTEGQADVYLIETAGGKPQRLTPSGANETAPTWSSDGRFLYFSSDQDHTRRIWKIPVQGGPSVPVTTQGGFTGIEAPDGRSLFFTAEDPKTNHLRLMEHFFEDGREEVRVDSLYNQSPYTLAATDTGLYYLNWELSQSCFHLYRLSFATRQTADLGTLPRSLANYYFEWGLSVSPDEQWIAYGWIDQTESDIMMIEPFSAE